MYSAFVALGLPLGASTMDQANLREELWKAGEIMRILNNVLGRTREFGGLRDLLRKCFVRIRYMMDESFDGIFKREEKEESRYVGDDEGAVAAAARCGRRIAHDAARRLNDLA